MKIIAAFLYSVFVISAFSCVKEVKSSTPNGNKVSVKKYNIATVDSDSLILGDYVGHVIQFFDTISLWKRDENKEEYLFPFGLSNELTLDRLRCYRKANSFTEEEILSFLDNTLISYECTIKRVKKSNTSFEKLKSKLKSKFNFFERPEIFTCLNPLNKEKYTFQEFNYGDYMIQVHLRLEDIDAEYTLYISIQYIKSYIRDQIL